MSRKLLPAIIYEPLPLFYAATGAASAAGIESLVGQISGVALLVIGFVIHHMRYQYRQTHDRILRRIDAC